MTYGHLQADCLYTGIRSVRNARYRVWEAFTFFSAVVELHKTLRLFLCLDMLEGACHHLCCFNGHLTVQPVLIGLVPASSFHPLLMSCPVISLQWYDCTRNTVVFSLTSLPAVSDQTVKGCNSVFGRIRRLSDDTSVHQAR